MPGYLASLAWIGALENYYAVGLAGTGKYQHSSSGSVSPQSRPVTRFCYFTAAYLAENLYRGLAAISVGHVIKALLCGDLVSLHEVEFAPLAIGSHWLFGQ